jgi:hypothetical protein
MKPKMTKENPNPNSLAALRAKYALLDGDAPENKLNLDDEDQQERFLKLCDDLWIAWRVLPQAELILEEKNQSSIRRQQFFRKLPRP